MFVYILQSRANPNRFYTGLSKDPEARVKKHNEGGCSFTKANRPWQLRTKMWFADEMQARRFEKYLKSGSGRAFAKRRL